MIENKGSITISRPRGTDDPNYIEIQIHDNTSATRFLTVRIALSDFAEALTGLAHVPCVFDMRADHVGKVRESKRLVVPFGSNYVADHVERKRIAAEAFAPFEVDGWRGEVSDLFNHHRRTSNGYSVLFTRYVEPSVALSDHQEKQEQ